MCPHLLVDLIGGWVIRATHQGFKDGPALYGEWYALAAAELLEVGHFSAFQGAHKSTN